MNTDATGTWGTVHALRGISGMLGLLDAYLASPRGGVVVRVRGGWFTDMADYHFLVTIGSVTAALTLPETAWLSGELLGFDGPQPLRHDLHALGQVLQSAGEDAPGAHSVH